MVSSTLRLFGVVHVDRPRKVRAELDEFAADVDAVFIEQPETDVTTGTLRRVFFQTPLFFFGAITYFVLFAPFYAVLHRTSEEAEVVAVKRVAESHDLPVHDVDDHPILYMSRARPRWIAVNWILLAGLTLLTPFAFLSILSSVLFATGLLFFVMRNRYLWTAAAIPFSWGVLWYVGTWNAVTVGILVSLYAFYIASVLRIHDHRNGHMLRRVAEISECEGYETTCLVTGKAHLPGLVRLAPESGITVSRMHTSKWLRRSDEVIENPEAEAVRSDTGRLGLLDALRLSSR